MANWDWERVVAMLGGRGGTGRSRGLSALLQVRAYWDALRGAEAVPPRRLIEPYGMQDALSHVFLLERIAPGIARFRLAGSHLSDLMGMEVRGMPFSAMLAPASRNGAAALIEAVFIGPCIVELLVESERGLGRPALQGRLLLLPVCDDDGVCNRALGCIVTQGEIGRGPRRFSVTRQRTEKVRPRMRSPAGPTPPRELAAFAEEAGAFTRATAPQPDAPHPEAPPPRPPRGRPQLRIVRNDE